MGKEFSWADCCLGPGVGENGPLGLYHHLAAARCPLATTEKCLACMNPHQRIDPPCQGGTGTCLRELSQQHRRHELKICRHMQTTQPHTHWKIPLMPMCPSLQLLLPRRLPL